MEDRGNQSRSLVCVSRGNHAIATRETMEFVGDSGGEVGSACQTLGVRWRFIIFRLFFQSPSLSALRLFLSLCE